MARVLHRGKCSYFCDVGQAFRTYARVFVGMLHVIASGCEENAAGVVVIVAASALSLLLLWLLLSSLVFSVLFALLIYTRKHWGVLTVGLGAGGPI